MKSTDEKKGEKSDRKLTVLEAHGYALGKTIGAGSYATVKQVQSRVEFPKHPKVSQPCRSLIARILMPQPARLRIGIIRSDIWLEVSTSVAQTSIDDGFVKTAIATPKERETPDEGMVRITPAIFQGILNERPKITVDDKAETTKVDLNVKL
ncbi:hypothetical protein EAI_15419 [Harpegnathos saltator]|uniref:Uncharacterized protein n=1 Tax=Harpegnathos saltator TaxID=610380 RepID=E2BLD2_HARSA|nr:hypothetical protein EAI_15419 [Harpegnathos saltator]